jgi:hypothetical protein
MYYICVRYVRLLDDTEDSPVVKERGAKDQWIYAMLLPMPGKKQ